MGGVGWSGWEWMDVGKSGWECMGVGGNGWKWVGVVRTRFSITHVLFILNN